MTGRERDVVGVQPGVGARQQVTDPVQESGRLARAHRKESAKQQQAGKEPFHLVSWAVFSLGVSVSGSALPLLSSPLGWDLGVGASGWGGWWTMMTLPGSAVFFFMTG